jgi:DNA-binding MurR/RpiR family transcriptional regulator
MDSALFVIRQQLNVLPSAEKKAAQYVLAEPQKVIHYSITELAKQCGASQQKLVRIGILCSNSQDADLQITAACNLKKEDTACIISYSGENSAMIIVSEQAKKKGAAIITLTMESENTLRKAADISLVVPSLERVYRIGATISRINQFAVIDMLYSMLVSRDLDNCIMAFEQTMAATHVARPCDSGVY